MASDFSGKDLDLVTCFDCLHDMGDPVGAARHVRETLKPDGCWMIVEPAAGDRLEDNLNPASRIFYAASTMIRIPTSLDQPVGAALGAQAGYAKFVRDHQRRLRQGAQSDRDAVQHGARRASLTVLLVTWLASKGATRVERIKCRFGRFAASALPQKRLLFAHSGRLELTFSGRSRPHSRTGQLGGKRAYRRPRGKARYLALRGLRSSEPATRDGRSAERYRTPTLCRRVGLAWRPKPLKEETAVSVHLDRLYWTHVHVGGSVIAAVSCRPRPHHSKRCQVGSSSDSVDVIAAANCRNAPISARCDSWNEPADEPKAGSSAAVDPLGPGVPADYKFRLDEDRLKLAFRGFADHAERSRCRVNPDP